MANYAATNNSSAGGAAGTNITASSTYAAIITMGSSSTTPVRGKLYDVLIGTNGTPADNVMEFQILRTTECATGVAGGTTITAAPLDSNDKIAVSRVTVNSTGVAAGAASPSLWYIGINQRASYRWVAAPGGELIWPATGSAAISLQGKGAAGIGLCGATMFSE